MITKSTYMSISSKVTSSKNNPSKQFSLFIIYQDNVVLEELLRHHNALNCYIYSQWFQNHCDLLATKCPLSATQHAALITFNLWVLPYYRSYFKSLSWLVNISLFTFILPLLNFFPIFYQIYRHSPSKHTT